MAFDYTAPGSTGPAFAQPTKAPDVQGFITAARAKGVPDSQTLAYLKQKGLVGGQPAPTPAPQSYGSKVIDAAKAGVGAIGNAIQEGARATGLQRDSTGKQIAPADPTKVFESGLKVASGAADVVNSPVSPAVSAVATPVVNAAADKISNIPLVQEFANSSYGNATSRVAEDVGNAANVVGTVAGVKGLVDSVPKFVDSVKNIKFSSEAPETSTEPPPLDEAKVTDLYNRAIRPTVSGKSTEAQIARANSQAITGLQAVADNKPNLEFTNADGETITNTTPKTVDQLNQGLGQTKKVIFQQYDAAAHAAGEKGVTVSGPKIASELDPIINSKSLALANPQAIEYAKATQARFIEAGEITATDAQDVIQHYNDSLKAFYRNPSYDTASKASIDALLATKMREALDEGISGATGEQYQALKNQYGALSAIEKDVSHRAVVWARQNKVGLGANIANIGSGAELVRGLLTMNPADIAVSGAIKGIQKYVQYLNNPDVQIAKIFSEIEKSGRSSTGSMSAPVEPEPVSSASPEPTPTPTKSQPLTKGSVKIPGMDTAPGTSPESVASKMDDTDFYTLKQYLNNPSDLNVHMHADPIIQGMGIGKLPHAEQVSFLKEALDLYENNSTKTIKASEL